MFPTDSISIYKELIGSSSSTLVTTYPTTIVGFSIQQSSVASESHILCGNTTIAKNYAKDFPFNKVNFLCNDTIGVSKTGQDSASFIVTYVPYNLRLTATSTATIATSTATTTISISTISGFTYGEVMTIFLLLLLFTITFFAELKKWIFGQKVENQAKLKYDKDI